METEHCSPNEYGQLECSQQPLGKSGQKFDQGRGLKTTVEEDVLRKNYVQDYYHDVPR